MPVAEGQITREELVKKMMEIKGNPFLFLDMVYISDAEKGLVKMEMWPHLLEALRTFHDEKLTVVIKSRQIGISWLLATFSVWIALTQQFSRVFLMSMGEREAIELLRKCRFIFTHLPLWMQVPMITDSKTEIEFDIAHSQIIALPATEDAGRSADGTVIICDEWDYHTFAEANFGAAKPAIDMGARKFIAATTIDGRNQETFCKRAVNQCLNGESNFKLLFYPYDVRPDRDAEWYAGKAKEMPDWMMQKEYPRSLEEAMSPLSSVSPFDKDALARLLRNASEPIETRRGYVHIIHPPRVGVHYVGGGDVAEGVGLDSSAFVILGADGLSTEVCAVIHSNSIRTDMFAWEINELCKEYRSPLIGIENNSIGVATINTLRDLDYRNLYFSDKMKQKPGWTNTEFSRGVAINELAIAVKDASLITKFKQQILEMMQMHYNEKRNNRPEAGPGAHDDLVMCLAIGYQMMKSAPKGIPFKPMFLGGQAVERTFRRT